MQQRHNLANGVAGAGARTSERPEGLKGRGRDGGRVGVERGVNVMQSSNKVHASAARGCTWSTPTGMVHEFSDPMFARTSEKAIVRWWAAHGRFKDLR